MNEELIKELLEEREYLYPNGCPVQPRESNVTYADLIHFLRWNAYDFVIERYEEDDDEHTLEEAHEFMQDVVIDMFSEFDC